MEAADKDCGGIAIPMNSYICGKTECHSTVGDPWRNGSASDSRSEGCVFDSRRVQNPGPLLDPFLCCFGPSFPFSFTFNLRLFSQP